MSEERNRRIWEELMREGEQFFTEKESLEQFKFRMEMRGFVLDFIKPTGKEGLTDQAFFEAVITYLNEKAGTHFRTRRPSANATLVLAQRKNGYTLDNFKTIIDKKCQQWLGTQYQEALTVETLFSHKHMENYFGQILSQKSPTDGRESNRPEQRNAFNNLDDAIESAKRNV
jgi:uncharacterized phage protein (TIGR02220 family)